MVEGGTLGVSAFGDSEGEVGGAGGDAPVAGETAGESDDGGTTAGAGAGDNDLLGGVTTGVLVGDKAGEEAGDWAIVELNNNAANSIRTKERAIVDGVWRRLEKERVLSVIMKEKKFYDRWGVWEEKARRREYL